MCRIVKWKATTNQINWLSEKNSIVWKTENFNIKLLNSFFCFLMKKVF